MQRFLKTTSVLPPRSPSANRSTNAELWHDKSAAILSYAKQVRNRELINCARRIIARAYRQMGVLLREFDGRGKSSKNVVRLDFARRPTRREAAAAANITPTQQEMAMRIAEITLSDFEETVESSDDVPGPTALARLSRSALRTTDSSKTETMRTHTSKAELAAQWRRRFEVDLMDSIVRLGRTMAAMASHDAANRCDIAQVARKLYAEHSDHLAKAIDCVAQLRVGVEKTETHSSERHGSAVAPCVSLNMCLPALFDVVNPAAAGRGVARATSTLRASFSRTSSASLGGS